MNATIPARVGSDVYIRDSDDATVQMKAFVYDIDFTTQEAKVGFYPERDSRPSQAHLPDIYRAEGVPLSELSLEPHAGAEQRGYAEVLARADTTGQTDLTWTDTDGMLRSGVPGAPPIGHNPLAGPPPLKAVPAAVQPIPEFGAPETNLAIGMPGAAPAPAAGKKPKADSAKEPLFKKAELLKKVAEIEDGLAKLRGMIDLVTL